MQRSKRLTGVMLRADLKSCITVEDFLQEYERESLKLGQHLMQCPDASWFPEEATFEAVGYSRMLSEEVKQVARFVRCNSGHAEEDSCASPRALQEGALTMQADFSRPVKLQAPFMLGWSLCIFSVGLALGRLGW
mmetsp:Transcript_46811/g.111258  ORF Transcript_46811/g.111258 Transcript_46811/m.111258 type:complete len:135 (-) Transcript_46811:142-546(-)